MKSILTPRVTPANNWVCRGIFLNLKLYSSEEGGGGYQGLAQLGGKIYIYRGGAD